MTTITRSTTEPIQIQIFLLLRDAMEHLPANWSYPAPREQSIKGLVDDVRELREQFQFQRLPVGSGIESGTRFAARCRQIRRLGLFGSSECFRGDLTHLDQVVLPAAWCGLTNSSGTVSWT
jgi:hypothetical protein